MHETMGGTTFWDLELLVTAPEHQGRGAGTMVLRWVMERAEGTRAEESGRVGVPCFLEATRAGRPVYERVGFEVRRRLVLDGKRYGGEVDGELWVMVRDAGNGVDGGGSG